MPSPEYGTGRVTPVRRIIANTAAELQVAFTVEELARAAARADRRAGAIATVYRAVKAMERAGYIERVGARDGSALYARCASAHHHHHVVCDGCGRVSEASCPVSTQLDHPSPEGFVITRHEVTLYGLCPSCARMEAI